MEKKQKIYMTLDLNQIQNSTNTTITDLSVVKINPYGVNLSGILHGEIIYV